MKKNDLLKNIADTAYNIGFGAKKHFATYDMVTKLPGLIAFFSTALGIYALVFDELSTKFISASVLVFGVIGMYVFLNDEKKEQYNTTGIELTRLFNESKRLYCRAKAGDQSDVATLTEELATIEQSYYKVGISKQLLFSDWYAHYKFFWQHQIDWIDEHKNFSLFRDKLPLSFMFFVVVVLLGLLWLGIDWAALVCSRV